MAWFVVYAHSDFYLVRPKVAAVASGCAWDLGAKRLEKHGYKGNFGVRDSDPVPHRPFLSG